MLDDDPRVLDMALELINQAIKAGASGSVEDYFALVDRA